MKKALKKILVVASKNIQHNINQKDEVVSVNDYDENTILFI